MAEPVFSGVSPEKPLDRISTRIFAQITCVDGSVIKFTAHDLCRTALTLLDRANMSGYAIKRIANHAMQDDVTEGYINDDPERLRNPMELLEKLVLSTRRAA